MIVFFSLSGSDTKKEYGKIDRMLSYFYLRSKRKEKRKKHGKGKSRKAAKGT